MYLNQNPSLSPTSSLPVKRQTRLTKERIVQILDEITVPYNYVYGIFEELQNEIKRKKDSIEFDYSAPLYEILLSQSDGLVRDTLRHVIHSDERLFQAYDKAINHLSNVFNHEYAQRKVFDDYLSNAVFESIQEPVTQGISCQMDFESFKKAHGKVKGLEKMTMFDFSGGSFAGMHSQYIKRIFSEISHARYVCLNDFKLHTCNANQIRVIFRAFPQLNGIALDDNQLEKMTPVALKELAVNIGNIKSLSLRGTDFTQIPPALLEVLFQNMKNVTKLDLTDCNFGGLSDKTKSYLLSYLKNLRCIVLDESLIQKGNFSRFIPQSPLPQVYYRPKKMVMQATGINPSQNPVQKSSSAKKSSSSFQSARRIRESKSRYY